MLPETPKPDETQDIPLPSDGFKPAAFQKPTLEHISEAEAAQAVDKINHAIATATSSKQALELVGGIFKGIVGLVK